MVKRFIIYNVFELQKFLRKRYLRYFGKENIDKIGNFGILENFCFKFIQIKIRKQKYY